MELKQGFGFSVNEINNLTMLQVCLFFQRKAEPIYRQRIQDQIDKSKTTKTDKIRR